jgi:hypothetical protein
MSGPTISNKKLGELAEELKRELFSNQITVSVRANQIQTIISREFCIRYSGFGEPWKIYKNEWTMRIMKGELSLPDFIKNYKNNLAGKIELYLPNKIKWQCNSCGENGFEEINNDRKLDARARAKLALETHRNVTHPEDLLE